MFKNSLDNKPFFTRPDGIKVRDLTQSMFDLKEKSFSSYEMYRVPREYAMRPDLIAKAVYNNNENTELLLKHNGISNPFSINEGDIILIPNGETIKNNVISGTTATGNSDADALRQSYKYIDPLKRPKKGETSKFDNRGLSGGAVNGAGDGSGDGSGGQAGGVSGANGAGGIGSNSLDQNGQVVNTADNSLPPNLATGEESQVTIRGGRVYFGDSAETCLKSGLSTGEFLAAIVTNKNK